MRQVLFLCLFLTAMNARAAVNIDLSTVGSIYGKDDRELVTTQSTKEIQELSRSVALIVSADLLEENFFKTTIKAQTLQETLQMCVDERFSNKSALPGCTGFLIGPDLMATAGHCFQTSEDCMMKKVIFDVDSKKQTKKGYSVLNSNVFSCKSIVAQSFDGESDFTIIKLDRAPKKRPALKLNLKNKIADNARVFMIGHPFGLPLMLSKSAKVNRNTSDISFTAGLDSFEGNSGSPVFNASTLEVEGILVNGQQDIVLDSKNECYRNAKYEEDNGAEGIFRISGLLPFLH
nr:serine protease [Bacteriovorax sp. HI3]